MHKDQLVAHLRSLEPILNGSAPVIKKFSPIDGALEGDVEIRFFHGKTSRLVHVLDTRLDAPLLDLIPDDADHSFTRGLINIALHRLKARCGTTIRWYLDAYIETFDDEHMCHRCVAATPESERYLLFEHDTDEGDDDAW